MNNDHLNIIADDSLWETVLPDYEEVSRQIFSTVIDFVKSNEDIDFLALGKPLNINLALSNDAAVQKLNSEFRGLDKPTNVLSFANLDDESFDENLKHDDIIELGDIIIALETMQREAASEQLSFHDHYCHLFTHGLLHLLGFDHQEDDEAEYMEGYEIKILQNLNIANPYKE